MANRELKILEKIFNISYEIKNPKKGKNIIILHGWGSNKEIMKQAFFSKFDEFTQVYIDMPGFGNSTNNYILKTDDYAKIIDKFLESINIKKDVIIGHSFGGKVATLLKPKLLVLLSSAGILEKKPISVKMKIAIFKLFKFFGGSKLYSLFASKDVEGMSQNMYETFKNVVDENFEKSFENFSEKALIFWGKDDKATNLKSGEKISKLIKNSRFFPLDGDHYFFLDNKDKIAQIIEKECGRS